MPGRPGAAAVAFTAAFENIDPGLDPMRTQELTVGVEHQLTARLAVSARFVHKQIDKAVEDIGSIEQTAGRLRHRQSRLRERDRSVRRRAVPQGCSRLRRRGARGATAPRAELGAHRQLRLEPPARQLLRALAVG